MATCEMCHTLLSEGLDLCVRARKLEEQVDISLQAGMGRIYAEGTNCGTPALWVQEQYNTDLVDWESRAKAYLTKQILQGEHQESDDA